MTDRPLNSPAEIPPELDRWNWGAFLLHWIWGIGNSVFIALLMFVPLVNLVMIFVLGAKGSRWAWRNRAWRDAEHFKSVQRKWAVAGVATWALVLVVLAGLALGLPRIMKGSEAYAITVAAARADPRVSAALGDDWAEDYWITGSVQASADGTGSASYAIPVEGSKGAGTIYSRGVRSTGIWDMRLIVVRTESGETFVLVNKDNAVVPESGVDI